VQIAHPAADRCRIPAPPNRPTSCQHRLPHHRLGGPPLASLACPGRNRSSKEKDRCRGGPPRQGSIDTRGLCTSRNMCSAVLCHRTLRTCHRTLTGAIVSRSRSLPDARPAAISLDCKHRREGLAPGPPAYDLRHAVVSLWLNAGAPAPDVAERAGHSLDVLLRVYAKCIDGHQEIANRRIDDALAA
jgi:hypothetical protein